jgi:selenocysteine lyase/cysteine desulfurase
MHRRTFLSALAVPLSGLSTVELAAAAARGAAGRALREARARGRAPEVDAADETLWSEVSRAYVVDRSQVNFNNGGCSPAPWIAQEAMRRHLEFSNKAPPHAMWRELEPQKEGVRQRLAREWGVDAEEVAITRNASEGLQICQFGFDLQRGDEVLTTNQDYPRMIATWKQRERREGVVLRQISLPVPCEQPGEVVERLRAAITPKTKLILVCHMINLTGQVLPVREIAALGRERGIPVIVDGAHAFAHLDFKIGDLGCDYYATSLHKWLTAPVGSGMLFVRRDKIPGLWPLMAADEALGDDIRKFEQFGTHPIANFLAIAEALTLHQEIGGARKLARLVHLRDRWAHRLRRHGRVRLHTSLAPGFAGGLATLQVDGIDSADLCAFLWSKHKILTTAIKHDEFEGVRVSPNVYSTTEEVDRFCEAVEGVLRDGLPATAAAGSGRSR